MPSIRVSFTQSEVAEALRESVKALGIDVSDADIELESFSDNEEGMDFNLVVSPSIESTTSTKTTTRKKTTAKKTTAKRTTRKTADEPKVEAETVKTEEVQADKPTQSATSIFGDEPEDVVKQDNSVFADEPENSNSGSVFDDEVDKPKESTAPTKSIFA